MASKRSQTQKSKYFFCDSIYIDFSKGKTIVIESRLVAARAKDNGGRHTIKLFRMKKIFYVMVIDKKMIHLSKLIELYTQKY